MSPHLCNHAVDASLLDGGAGRDRSLGTQFSGYGRVAAEKWLREEKRAADSF